MSEKRKRVVLTLKKKLELLKRLDEGEKVLSLSSEYGVSKNTIRDIRNNKANLYEYITKVESDGPLNRKTMKKPRFELVDEALIDWFSETRAAGKAISGMMCCEKAEYFHRAFNLEGTFKASNGWLERFKHRYGICEVKLSGNIESNAFSQINVRQSKSKTLDFKIPILDRKLPPSEVFDIKKIISNEETENSLIEISPDIILFENSPQEEVSTDEALNAVNLLLKHMQQKNFNTKDITLVKNIYKKIKGNNLNEIK